MSVQVLQGDCRELLATLPAESIDLLVTDPPYLTGDARVPVVGAGVAKRYVDSTSVGIPWGYSLDWISEVARLKPRHWIVFGNYLMLGDLQANLAQHAKISCVFVWRKSNAPRMTRPVPRLDCEFIVWARDPKASCGRMGEFESMVIDLPMLQAGCFATERILDPGSKSAAHPTQKPLSLMRLFMERLAEPGDVVLDPFAGTGTTLVAALSLRLSCIGIERDPEYAALIEKRCSVIQPSFPMGEAV